MHKKELAVKLLAMSQADQAMREKAVYDISQWNEILDKKHTAELKGIVERYGWPTVTLVGEHASRAAWLLAQHADHDAQFQERCLQLMRDAPAGEVCLADIAYLEDRVRCAQGLPQLYGTQFDNPGKRFGPKAVQDRAHLDQRRKAMGLSTFKEYRRLMIEYYGNDNAV
jgi:hypothetical protein